MTVKHFNPQDNQLIKSVCGLAFPDYTGRKIKVRYSVKSLNLSSYWDGGSRSYFRIVELSTMKVVTVPDNHPVFNKAAYDVKNVSLPQGFVVVEHCYFCGKDLGLTIHTSDDAPLLSDGTDISEDLKQLLACTYGLKSSYAGIKDYRGYRLYQRFGWSEDKVELVREQAIEKGYLTKGKALTNAGKDVVSTLDGSYRNRW